MLARCAAALALAGSAAAFSPMMSMETGRRQVLQGGAAAVVAAPLLRANPAAAGVGIAGLQGAPNKAPVITIFDHRGCNRGGPNKEYSGEPANSQDDEMCVKVYALHMHSPAPECSVVRGYSCKPPAWAIPRRKT